MRKRQHPVPDAADLLELIGQAGGHGREMTERAKNDAARALAQAMHLDVPLMVIREAADGAGSLEDPQEILTAFLYQALSVRTHRGPFILSVRQFSTAPDDGAEDGPDQFSVTLNGAIRRPDGLWANADVMLSMPYDGAAALARQIEMELATRPF